MKMFFEDFSTTSLPRIYFFFLALDKDACPKSSPIRDSGAEYFYSSSIGNLPDNDTSEGITKDDPSLIFAQFRGRGVIFSGTLWCLKLEKACENFQKIRFLNFSQL